MARQVAVQSLNHRAEETAHSQALQYNMLARKLLHRLVSRPCGFSFISCYRRRWIRSEGGALVDSLETLSVLHRHEEFLSQVLEGFVAGQIQAVKTDKKNKKKIFSKQKLKRN